jgi:hypothetical protein
LVEEAFRLALKVPAAVPVVVFVPELFVVPLLALAGPDEVVLLLAVPTLEEVLPPLAELLLNVELPTDPELPPVPEDAALAVVPEDDVELVPFEAFAVTPNVPASDLLLLAVKEPFVENAFVVPLALLEFSAATFVVPLEKLEPSAATFVVPLALFEVADNTFVVPLDFVALAEAEEDSLAVKLLLAPACCMCVSLELNVFELLFVLESSLEYVLSLLLVAFNEELMLDVDVFVLVTFELLFTVSSLFCPR